MKRRRFLETGLHLAAAGAILPASRFLVAESASAAEGDRSAGAGASTPAPSTAASPADGRPAGRPLLAVAHGASAAAITTAAVDALGGIGRFVKRNDRVVVKPNIGWDRTPEQAANTNPEVVGTLVRLCLEAGARSVLVMDNTCNDARRCYVRSGISDAAKESGAEVRYFEEERARAMQIGGDTLDEWPVHPSFVEVDCLINVPIVKHHGLAGLTIGMKNWLGAIGGPRNRLHQSIDRSVVDLAAFFRPSLTVVDGVRILERGGPQGGSLEDVRRLDTVIATADPLVAEVRGAALHGWTAERLRHISLAAERGLGRVSWDPAEERFIELG